MTDNTSNARILADGDNTWVKVPYHPISFGHSFGSIAEQLMFRVQDTVSENDKDKIRGTVHEAYGTGINIDQIRELFGLEEDRLSSGMLGRPFYQDTRVGGNDAINCIWQFNRDDDIMHPVTTIDKNKCIGEGRVYATTTQTNQQICWFTFGVPYYSSMFATFKSAFNDKLARLNTDGYLAEDGEEYNLSELFGRYLTLTVCIWAIPLKIAYEYAAQRANTFKINRFYELRTRMQLYYKFVDSMLGHWLIMAGLYNNGVPKDTDGTGAGWHAGDNSALNKNFTLNPEYIPDALRLTGCSIFEILRRRAVNAGVADNNNSDSYGSDESYEARSQRIRATLIGTQAVPIRYAAMESMRKEDKDAVLNASDKSAAQKALDDLLSNAEQKLRASAAARGSEYDDDNGSWSTAFWHSVLGATQFIGFRIDKSTDASESFSNSTQPSAFAEDYNAKVKEVAAKAINYGIKGEANSGSLIGKVVDSTGDFIRGALQALQSVDFIGITDLAQAAVTGTYFDAPEQYAGSDFNKSHSLSFQLRSPYGDKVSIYQSIMVPLFCILAGALPRSGGANSYVQPFLCRVYCRGMFAVPLGIIDSVSIKRGDSEFGWTYDNLPTCVDVNISIKDMSPIMYVCMYDSMFEELSGIDSAFNEYLLTLSAVGLWERISMVHKYARGLQYKAHLLRNRYFNGSFWSHAISQYAPIQFAASFYPKTAVSDR